MLRSFIRLTSIVATGLLVGCGDSVTGVGGVITVGGEPVEDAYVLFTAHPEEANSVTTPPPSMARTDAEGRYSLEQADGTLGAVVGKHTVTVSTALESGTSKPRAELIAEHERIFEYEVTGPTDQADFDFTPSGKKLRAAELVVPETFDTDAVPEELQGTDAP